MYQQTILEIARRQKKSPGTWFYDVIFNCLRSSSLYARNTIFSSCLNWKSNSTIGKSLISWSIKWYGLLYFNGNFSRYEGLKICYMVANCWISSFFPCLWILDPSYLEKFSSTCGKPYHFLGQLFGLFPMVLLLFQFKQLEKNSISSI